MSDKVCIETIDAVVSSIDVILCNVKRNKPSNDLKK